MSEFPKKWLKYLGEFADTAESMSKEELEQELIKSERALNGIEKDMEDDAKLQAAKQEATDLAKEYTDMIKSLKATIKYILFIFDERGISVADDKDTGGDKKNQP